MERRGFICFPHLYFLIAYRHISYQKIRLITILFRNFASILNLLVFKENKKMTDQRYDKKSVTRITFYYNFISKASKKCDGNHCCLIPSNDFDRK